MRTPDRQELALLIDRQLDIRDQIATLVVAEETLIPIGYPFHRSTDLQSLASERRRASGAALSERPAPHCGLAIALETDAHRSAALYREVPEIHSKGAGSTLVDLYAPDQIFSWLGAHQTLIVMSRS